jgi:hypothetical protein
VRDVVGEPSKRDLLIRIHAGVVKLSGRRNPLRKVRHVVDQFAKPTAVAASRWRPADWSRETWSS